MTETENPCRASFPQEFRFLAPITRLIAVNAEDQSLSISRSTRDITDERACQLGIKPQQVFQWNSRWFPSPVELLQGQRQKWPRLKRLIHLAAGANQQS